MCFCASCGILLSRGKGRESQCNPCFHWNKPQSIAPCKCDYCCRSYDWVDTDFTKRGIMGHLFSSSNQTETHQSKTDNHGQNQQNSKFESLEDGLRCKWEKEQLELKRQLRTDDSSTIRRIKRQMEQGTLKEGELYIGGVDISFIKGDAVNACSAFVVLSYPDLEVVYEDYEMIELTAPYIPGFLAFREVEFIVKQYHKLKATNPQYLPQVIFVDGNGILHPRGFGLASHLGVLLGVPCLGVAKTLIHVDGVENDDTHRDKKESLMKGGDTFLLQNTSGDIMGKAVRSSDSAKNPVFVSPGHMISVDTAVMMVLKCCRHRIPEPTRKADLNSREYLRKHHPDGF